MLINRIDPDHRTAGTCPHCGQALAGQLVHLEGLRFLCYQCLREIHADTGLLIGTPCAAAAANPSGR
jgi:hypothetical protein